MKKHFEKGVLVKEREVKEKWRERCVDKGRGEDDERGVLLKENSKEGALIKEEVG